MIDKVKPFLLHKQSDVDKAEVILKGIQGRLTKLKQDLIESLATAEANKDDTEMIEIADELAEITINQINHDIWLISQDIDELADAIK